MLLQILDNEKFPGTYWKIKNNMFILKQICFSEGQNGTKDQFKNMLLPVFYLNMTVVWPLY